MKDLLYKVASIESDSSGYCSFSPGHEKHPRAILARGSGAKRLASAVKKRFGHAVTVVDVDALESQQIDHATGAGAPIVGIYRQPVNGLDTSSSGSVLLDEIRRLDLDAKTDSELPPETAAVILSDDHADPIVEDEVGNTVAVYGSVESFLDDFALSAVFEVCADSNERFFEDEKQILARFVQDSNEADHSVTSKITVGGLTLEPCAHGHTDPDTECSLCATMRARNAESVAPILTSEGDIIEMPKSEISVLPNKKPAVALPDEAGQMTYQEHEDGEQTITVPEDVIIEEDDDEPADYD